MIKREKILKINFLTILTLILLPIVSQAQISSGGAFSIEKSAVATGGGTSSSGAFTLSGTTGQNAAGVATTTLPFDQIGGFWTPEQLAPTAARVSISGKVRTANGSGIKNVIVTLTAPSGAVRSTVTGSFGIYRFNDVEVGETYILTVSAKRYLISNPTRIIQLMDEITDADFISENQ